MAKPISFSVLGPLQIVRAGKDLTPPGPREQALIAALAMRAGEVVDVADLMEILWGEHPPRSGSKAVQGVVSRARTDLGRYKDVIARRDGGYVLDVPREHVDAGRFVVLGERARVALEELDVEEAARLLRDALAEWRADAPHDLGDSIAARAWMRELTEARLAAYEDLFEAELAAGKHAGLVAEIERELAEHPQRERLWGHLMLALYRSGRRSEALAAFARVRDLLAGELGLDPSPDLRELEERMLARDPTLDVVNAPAAVDLPEEETPFVGREPEIDTLLGLIQTPGLVTICGSAGVGKTRLALRAARAAHPTLGGLVRWLGPRDPFEPGTGRALVVLDGCEPGAHRFLETLGDDAPATTVLATAREPLSVQGEHVLRLEPLPVSIGGPSPSLRLFVDRARAADPWFDPADERSMSDLCARVGGVPYAIELIASWAGSTTPAELLARLNERFHGAAAVSVDDVLAWVWDRLSSAEQQVFACARVFAGAFTSQAMEHLREGAAPVLQVLAARALLVRDGDRFRIPGAARAFALERLGSSGEDESARRAHGALMVTLAEQLGEQVTGAREASAVHETGRWLDDIRIAFDRAMVRRDADTALRIPYALRWYALFRFDDEVFDWARAAGAAFELDDHPLIGEVLGCAALSDPSLIERARRAATRIGRAEPVMATFAEATVAARENDVVRALARADALTTSEDVFAARYWRAERARLLVAAGKTEEATRAMNSHRLAAARLACPTLRAVSLQAFSEVVRASDPEAAATMAKEAVALAEEVGNQLVLARA